MDINTLSQGVGLFGVAVNALKQVIEMLPDTAKKTEAQSALARAEREFKIAEATAATNLGYEICRKHFPPEIMLSEDNANWNCPQCGNTKKPEDWSSFGYVP